MSQPLSAGIYPMLYAFFDGQGRLRMDAFRKQVDAVLATDAKGLAILGLGTEVSRLSADERIQVLDAVSQYVAGRAPLIVTVFGSTPEVQIDFAQRAVDAGASALLLQPPVTDTDQYHDESRLVHFFSKIIASVQCQVGIQNAPEFLGFGLGDDALIALAKRHNNFAIAKLECSAVALQLVADALKDSVMVFNGRCGLELPDNLRAGAQGLIPALETVDKTSAIYRTFVNGAQDDADKLYTDLLPTLSFIMQGIPHYLTYGKLIASMRLGIEFGGSRQPALLPTDFGVRCASRFANHLGKLEY